MNIAGIFTPEGIVVGLVFGIISMLVIRKNYKDNTKMSIIAFFVGFFFTFFGLIAVFIACCSSDRIYNQYCGHEEDRNKRYIYQQEDMEMYTDSERVNLSPEARKEYLKSLDQKYMMGMISMEEYRRLKKRYK